MQKSELILNKDGSIYHLKLRPHEIARTIITVGDPNRVKDVSQYFDSIAFERTNREFCTATGKIGTKDLTVISTGIGTDNVDIVMNELDALFNIDLKTGLKKTITTPLQFIRIGTSGSIQENIPVDSFVVSSLAIGLDGLLHNYSAYPNMTQKELYNELMKQTSAIHLPINPYVIEGDSDLLEKFKTFMIPGITLTAGGFYAPQGRNIRMEPKNKDLIDEISQISIQNYQITNLEMETAGIYGLASIMGHQAISLNAILANRITGKFSQSPGITVEKLIQKSLEIISAN